MKEVRWSPLAAQDLEAICAYIEQDNLEAALPVAKAIYEACGRLVEFPYLGRASRLNGRRELSFPPFPYIAVYRIRHGVVEILRIYHAAQDRP